MDLTVLLPEIEAAAVRGWPALETALVDGWLWRHSSGGSTRANSVATLAFTGFDLDAAIAIIERMCHARGVPACFAVSDVSQPRGLDAHLAARGYRDGGHNVTMAKWLNAQAVLPSGVTIASEPSPDWMVVYLSGLSESRRGKAPAILKNLPRGAHFISGVVAGRTMSCGLTIGDGEVASVQCMATLPEGRRQGGAQRVLATIEHLAAREGRRALYLQAEGTNAAAHALYHSVGFVEVGTYHTRTQAA